MRIYVNIVVINIRPLKANAEFINVLRTSPKTEAINSAKKALSLAKGTIGTAEIREHLAINTYQLSSQPEVLQEPEVLTMYRFAVEEMEKQVGENSDSYLKIKQNILLAQLYGMLAIYGGSLDALRLSVEQYNKAVLVSGDGDFACLVNFLVEKKRLEMLLSPNHTKASVLLRRAVPNNIVFLERFRSRLEYTK